MISRRSLVATTASVTALSLAGIASAAAPKGDWLVGKNYWLVDNPQPPTVAAGKVEVSEVFWYGCGHCYALDPLLEDWQKKKPAYIQFARVPVIWGPGHRQHAKLYYTLLALHRLDLHPKVFHAIHMGKQLLADRDESKARALHLAFLAEYGITEPQFDEAYDSMSVSMNLQRAVNYTREMAVDSVPILFVNGRYATSVGAAGGEAQLIALLTDLAESEKR